LIEWARGKSVSVPLWLRILEAVDFDPLRAQECEQQLDLPPPYLIIVLHMAHGDPTRAREIVEHLNAEWWHRYLAVLEARQKAEEISE